MEEKIQGLLLLLEQESDFYEKLLEISLREQKSIISGKVDEIEKETQEKEKILLEINKLEKARMILWKDLSDAFSIPLPDLTLERLQEKFGEKYSERLSILQRQLETVVHKLKNVVESNTELIKTSLDYIQFSINLLSSKPSPTSYDIHKKKDASEDPTVLDKRI